MIVTSQKPLDKVFACIAPYTKVLIVGCDGCTQPPRGLREATTTGQLLELGAKLKTKKFEFKIISHPKQCDSHLVNTTLKPEMEGVEAVLSLACGIGVQTLANLMPEVPVFPAQDTHFMGAEERELATLEQRCAGCGDCLLAETGGICPVARCSKGLLNTACGGSKNGKCELSPERDCAWVLIYDRLKKQGKLDTLKQFRPPRDFQLTGWKIAT